MKRRNKDHQVRACDLALDILLKRRYLRLRSPHLEKHLKKKRKFVKGYPYTNNPAIEQLTLEHNVTTITVHCADAIPKPISPWMTLEVIVLSHFYMPHIKSSIDSSIPTWNH